MSNSGKTASKTWHNVFFVGQAVMFIAGFTILKDLPMEFQPIVAIASSAAWFTSSFLYSKIPDKTGKSKLMPSLSFWMGIAEVVLATLFWTVFEPKTTLSFYGKIFNMVFGAEGFVIFFSAAFFLRFPSLFKAAYPPLPPDPIEKLPTHIKEIINNGRVKVYKVSVISIFFFLGIGLLLLFFILQFVQNPGLILLFYVLVSILCFGTVAYLRQRTACKWQEEALASGISKEELEEAAKLGGVPWPKIKEE